MFIAKKISRKEMHFSMQKIQVLSQSPLHSLLTFRELCLLSSTCRTAHRHFRVAHHNNGSCRMFFINNGLTFTKDVHMSQCLSNWISEDQRVTIKHDKPWTRGSDILPLVDRNAPLCDTGIRPQQTFQVYASDTEYTIAKCEAVCDQIFKLLDLLPVLPHCQTANTDKTWDRVRFLISTWKLTND